MDPAGSLNRSSSLRNPGSVTMRRTSDCASPGSAAARKSAWNGGSACARPSRTVPSRARTFPFRAVIPSPNRMPFETVADPATSESVNPTPPTPGRKIVPPRRRADPSSAMRSPRSSAEFPAIRAEKRGRNPPRTTSSADRTAGTSPARDRIADRTGRISVSCPETSSRNRGDVSPTERVPASRRRGDSNSIRETDALRFPPSRRTDPATVAPRRARVLEPRRNSRRRSSRRGRPGATAPLPNGACLRRPCGPRTAKRTTAAPEGGPAGTQRPPGDSATKGGGVPLRRGPGGRPGW